jgi:hypothetical protein
MRKWLMCLKGKFCEEYMALLRTEIQTAEPFVSEPSATDVEVAV